MKNYHLTRPAEADLEDIFDYIAVHNSRAAFRQISRFVERFKFLAANSRSGEYRSDLEDIAPGVRSFSIGRYVIYFEPVDDGVSIVRVRHGSRDVRAALE
jgi:toxin ParE1/3/4